MSFGMCCLLCFVFYKLGSYNERNPDELWEKGRLGLKRLREWSQG